MFHAQYVPRLALLRAVGRRFIHSLGGLGEGLRPGTSCPCTRAGTSEGCQPPASSHRHPVLPSQRPLGTRPCIQGPNRESKTSHTVENG